MGEKGVQAHSYMYKPELNSVSTSVFDGVFVCFLVLFFVFLLLLF